MRDRHGIDSNRIDSSPHLRPHESSHPSPAPGLPALADIASKRTKSAALSPESSEVTSRPRITGVFVQPDIRRKRITVTTETSVPGQVRLSVSETSIETTCNPGVALLDFPGHELWSPAVPNLYTLNCQLEYGGEIVDNASVSFGMREFTVKEDRFYLNGRPIFVKGVRHEKLGIDENGALTDESRTRSELSLIKEAGFNVIRFTQTPSPGVILDMTDEIGLLVWFDLCLDSLRGKRSEDVKDSLREGLVGLRNHPSLAIWHVPRQGEDAALDEKALCRHIRTLDPSRVILCEGAPDTGVSPIYMRPYRDTGDALEPIEVGLGTPVERGRELYVANIGEPECLSVITELLLPGMESPAAEGRPIDDESLSREDIELLSRLESAMQHGFSARGLDRLYGGHSEFTQEAFALQQEATERQLDAIRANTKLAGYCCARFRDFGPCLGAGLLDRLGRPKPVFDAVKNVQSPLRPVVNFPQTNLTPRQEIPVSITLLNDVRLEGRADLSLQVVGPTNQVLWKKKRNVKVPRNGKELWSGSISASGSTGSHKFVIRLLQPSGVIAENAIEFHVFEPVEPCDIRYHLLDPAGYWAARCRRLAVRSNIHAPVHLVPPLGNSIRSYPDNELAQVLGQVKEGAVAIFFQPPPDWNDLAEILDPELVTAELDVSGRGRPSFRYAKLHPIFDGLPAGALMGQVYRDTLGGRAYSDTTEEDICGTFDGSAVGPPASDFDGATCWASDILTKRYGSGRIVFTHLRVLEALGRDPVADKLFVNLLRHFSRRSVPSASALPVHQKTVEWLRGERTKRVRRWMLLGMFPNWGGLGHETPYPPEDKVELDAAYPGWYEAISWKGWAFVGDAQVPIDFDGARSRLTRGDSTTERGVWYAYAEVTCERRGYIPVTIECAAGIKVWLNGKLLFARDRNDSETEAPREAFFKQGKNTVLLKFSQGGGVEKRPARFQLQGRELGMKWWK